MSHLILSLQFPPWYIFLPYLLYCPLISQVPHIKPVIHEHPPGPKGAGPRRNPSLFTSNRIGFATVMERWYHGPNSVSTRRCVVGDCSLYDMLIISGHLMRMVLVAAVCDKPATHKVGGFASHSHTLFCTLCWITSHDKEKPMAFQEGGKSFLFAQCTAILHPTAFCPWTNKEHHRLSEEYRQLSMTTAYKNFVKSYTSQYTQLSYLPYFSLTEQIVIDPIHDLFLGMCSFPWAVTMC